MAVVFLIGVIVVKNIGNKSSDSIQIANNASEVMASVENANTAVEQQTQGIEEVNAENETAESGSDTGAVDTNVAEEIAGAEDVATEETSEVTVAQIPMEEVEAYDPSSEYIIYGSDTGYIERYYLEQLTDEELRLARNEIYARHGRMFKDEMLQEYFNSKSWYTPIYAPEEFDEIQETELNEWEKANRELIKEVEDSRK